MISKALAPGPTTDRAQLVRWVSELGHPVWEVREDATRRLRALGYAAEGPMLEAWDAGPSPEQKLRLSDLLAPLNDAFIGAQPALLLRWRAIEVLESMVRSGAEGAESAQRVLERVAEGSPAQRERRAAHHALIRIRARSK